MNKTPELVDLGLPSGNLWMKYSIGASKETDLGNYYQFGSLKDCHIKNPLGHSSWETCPFNDGQQNKFNEEYFKVNRSKWFYKNNNLKPEYDIITQTYGKDYKTPTKEDFQELLDNTTFDLLADYKNSKIGGRLFTSKINGKTLFIPFNSSTMTQENFLWSATLHPYLSCAWFFHIYISNPYVGFGLRWYKFTIRGIKVKDE